MSSKWWVLVAVACGTFMSTLDSSIVNIALPTLTKALNADLYTIKWVVIIYLLILTCLMLPFGRLSDQYGRKKIFQLGLAVFTIGSILCGLSLNTTWLIFSRAVQGVGAAMLMANSPAIITATFPIGKRGKALGILAMFVSAGLVSGPSIGGFLITELGWRSIFFVNIAIGILGFILVHRFVTTDTPPEHQSFDWTGAFLQTLLLLSFIVVVDPPSISFSGNSPLPIPRLLMIGITIALAVIFVKVEAEAKAPLFDLSLLQNRTFWTGNLAMLLLYVSYSAMTIMMPFYFEEVLDFTPDKAGLFMTAIPLTIFIVAPIAGRLSDKLGSRELSFIGSTIATIGLLMMSGIFGPGIDNHSTPFQIILGLCMIGLATGLFQSPNNNAIMTSVPANKLGVASAFTATIRNLAFVTGTGMATGLFAWRFDQNHDFVNALHTTLLVAGLVAIGAMVASLGKKGGPLQKK